MLFYDTDFLRSEELVLRLDKTVEGNQNWLPTYHFHICDHSGNRLGKCDLRIGHNEGVYYGGNIGYQIFPEYRGRHYAGKACLLLYELAKRHGMDYLIITCNPDNYASRKTCEYAGCRLTEIVELPADNDMRLEKGETEKCIYRVDLQI